MTSWRDYIEPTSATPPAGYTEFQVAYLDPVTKRINAFSVDGYGTTDTKVTKYLKNDYTAIQYVGPYVIPTNLLFTYFDGYTYTSDNGTSVTGTTIDDGTSFTDNFSLPCYAAGAWYITTTNGKLWRSTNRTTWTDVHTLQTGYTDMRKMVVGATDELVMVSRDGLFYYSTNNGISWSSFTWTPGTLFDVFYAEGKWRVLYSPSPYNTMYLGTLTAISAASRDSTYSWDNGVIDNPYLCGFHQKSDGTYLFGAMTSTTGAIYSMASLPTGNGWSGTEVCSIATVGMYSDDIRSAFVNDQLVIWVPGVTASCNLASFGGFAKASYVQAVWYDTTLNKWVLTSSEDGYAFTFEATSDFTTFSTITITGLAASDAIQATFRNV
jgi:hypothetical protein